MKHSIYLIITCCLTNLIYAGNVSNSVLEGALSYFKDDTYLRTESLGNNQYLVEHRATGIFILDNSKTITESLLSVIQNNGDHLIMSTKLPFSAQPWYDEIAGPGSDFYKGVVNDYFDYVDQVSISEAENGDIIIQIKETYESDTEYGVMQELNEHFNEMHYAYTHLAVDQFDIYWDALDNFKDNELVGLKQSALPFFLVGQNWEEAIVEEPNLEGAIDQWSYVSESLELSFDLYNFQDRFDIYITGDVGEENTEPYLPYFEEFAKENPFEYSYTTEAVILPNYPQYVGIKATFLYDGSISGEDFLDALIGYYDYAEKVNEVFETE